MLVNARPGGAGQADALEIGWPRGESTTTQEIERYVIADYSSDGISLRVLEAGLYTYLRVDTPPVLGSRATDQLGGLGGYRFVHSHRNGGSRLDAVGCGAWSDVEDLGRRLEHQHGRGPYRSLADWWSLARRDDEPLSEPVVRDAVQVPAGVAPRRPSLPGPVARALMNEPADRAAHSRPARPWR